MLLEEPYFDLVNSVLEIKKVCIKVKIEWWQIIYFETKIMRFITLYRLYQVYMNEWEIIHYICEKVVTAIMVTIVIINLESVDTIFCIR